RSAPIRYTLSLHDALPIYKPCHDRERGHQDGAQAYTISFEQRGMQRHSARAKPIRVVHLQNSILLYDAEQEEHAERAPKAERPRSEEHTSELQSPCNLVCR